MGLLEQDPLGWARGAVSSLANEPGHIEDLIAARAAARSERRFDEADRIRAGLAAEGIILEDNPDGATTWRRKD